MTQNVRLLCIQQLQVVKNVLFITLVLFISYSCVCADPTARNVRMKSCLYDSDCIENAYCKNQTYCSCKENFIIYINLQLGAACLREATQIGDPCEQDLQCTKPFGTHALCDKNSRCQCSNNAHFKEGRCYESAGLGMKCKVTNNCKIDSDISVFCDKSVCVCPHRYHSNSAGTNCLKSAYIGRSCSSDETCVVPNSKCREVCRCSVKYIESQDERKCLKVADSVGESCEENPQCGEFLKTAECTNGTCQCSNYYHSLPTSAICWRTVALGGACSSDNECVVSSGNFSMAVCRKSVCQCSPGYSIDSKDPADCRLTSGSNQKIQLSTSIVLLSTIVGMFLLYGTCLH